MGPLLLSLRISMPVRRLVLLCCRRRHNAGWWNERLSLFSVKLHEKCFPYLNKLGCTLVLAIRK
jgi:hypothetical protein